MESSKKQQSEKLLTAAFGMLWLANVFVCMVQKMSNITLALYTDQLGGGEAIAGIAAMVFSIVSMLFRLLTGQLSDRYNGGTLLFLGSSVFAMSALGLIWATTPIEICVLRALQGAGYSAAATALTISAAQVIPETRMGEGMSYFGLAMSLSGCLAPPLGLWAFYRSSHLLLPVMMGGQLAIAALLGLILSRFTCPGERKQARLRIRLTPQVIYIGLITFFVYMALAVFFTFISIYAKSRGFRHTGTFFSLSAAAAILSRVVFGRVIDRRGSLYLLLPSCLLGVVCLIVLAVTETEWVYLFCGFGYGIFSGVLIPTLNTMAAQSGKREYRGTAIGIYYVFMDVGLAVGNILWGAIAQRLSYTMVFVSAGICLLIAGGYGMVGKKGLVSDP